MTLEATDFSEDAPLLLTSRCRKPLIEALVSALGAALQETDDVVVAMPEATLGLDTAVGVQLERLADLVGAPVLGGEDQTRALARTWIRRNRSRGTVEDVIAVVALFPVLDFVVLEIFPARLEVTGFEVPVGLHETLVLVVEGTRAAGVGCGLILSTAEKSATFQYSASGTTETSLTAGYGYGAYAGGYEA